jgi:hypothetical protein
MEPVQAVQPAPSPLPTQADFLAFAEKHYQVWVNACTGHHPVWFHKCCFTFSTHKKRPQLDHPDDQGVPYKRFLNDHQVEDVPSFAKLLVELSAERPGGLAGRLPTVNQKHPELPALDKREPADDLVALNQQVATQQATIDQLRQQLQLERTAAVEHEKKLLTKQYLLQLVNNHCMVRGWYTTMINFANTAKRAAASFQQTHDDVPTFGNLPRPNHPDPPGALLPEDPDYDQLTKDFLENFLAAHPDLRPK